jgi:hypothetical protein
VTTRARVAEDNRSAGGTTYVFVVKALKYFLHFFLGDAMLTAMLHISIRVVVKIPDDGIKTHRKTFRLLLNYNTTSCPRQVWLGLRAAIAAKLIDMIETLCDFKLPQDDPGDVDVAAGGGVDGARRGGQEHALLGRIGGRCAVRAMASF